MRLHSAEIVWWLDGNGAYQIGRLLRAKYNTGSENLITLYSGGMLSESLTALSLMPVLVRVSKECTETESVVEEFVSWCELHHYYGDKEGGDKKLPPHHVSYKRFTNEQLAELGDANEHGTKQVFEETWARSVRLRPLSPVS